MFGLHYFSTQIWKRKSKTFWFDLKLGCSSDKMFIALLLKSSYTGELNGRSVFNVLFPKLLVVQHFFNS